MKTMLTLATTCLAVVTLTACPDGSNTPKKPPSIPEPKASTAGVISPAVSLLPAPPSLAFT